MTFDFCRSFLYIFPLLLRFPSTPPVQLPDGIPLHFYASMISGLATTIASMPVDIVKTRIQNMRIVNGIPEYKVRDRKSVV